VSVKQGSALSDVEVVVLLAEEPTLLAIADAVAATQRRRRRAPRPSLLVVVAVLLLVAAATSLVTLREGRASIVDEALAVVGTAPVVHAVIAAEDPRGSVVEVATGRVRPVRIEIESWYDGERRLLRTTVRRNGVVVSEFLESPEGSSSSDGPVRTLPGYEPALDPALSEFARGYRAALAAGTVRLAGEDEVGGRRVQWLELERGRLRERVAVDRETYRPLLIEPFSAAGTPSGFRWRVVELESVVRANAILSRPVPRPPAPSRGDVRASAPLSARQAAARLVWPALWLGRRFEGMTLVSIERQELSRGYSPPAPRQRGGGEGLRLLYRNGERFVEIQQAPAAEPAYAFAGGRATFSWNPIPAEGFVELAALPGQERTTWLGQLRVGGVHLSLWGFSRSGVLGAARALRSIETGG